MVYGVLRGALTSLCPHGFIALPRDNKSCPPHWPTNGFLVGDAASLTSARAASSTVTDAVTRTRGLLSLLILILSTSTVAASSTRTSDSPHVLSVHWASCRCCASNSSARVGQYRATAAYSSCGSSGLTAPAVPSPAHQALISVPVALAAVVALTTLRAYRCTDTVLA